MVLSFIINISWWRTFLLFLNLRWHLFCFWFLSKKLASIAPGLITPLLRVSLQTWLNNTTWLVIHCGFLIIFLLPCLDRSSGSKSPLWLSWWGLFHSEKGNLEHSSHSRAGMVQNLPDISQGAWWERSLEELWASKNWWIQWDAY